LPDPNVPAQFYIANIGGAHSKGAEFGLNARATQNLDLFASLGFTHARFADGTTSSGQNVAGKKLPSTPDHTLTLGAQVTKPVTARLLVYGRGEVWFNGGFEYDDANTARQDAYSLANFRVGVRGGRMFGEVWLKNAFDTRYIPIAFAYSTDLAPSGFLGEMGAPRRVGAPVGVTF
jgi:iron complex outermembrane receptor protein